MLTEQEKNDLRKTAGLLESDGQQTTVAEAINNLEYVVRTLKQMNPNAKMLINMDEGGYTDTSMEISELDIKVGQADQDVELFINYTHL